MDKAVKDQIRNLVASGKTDKAVDAFIGWASASSPDMVNDLIGLKAQFASLKRNESLGLISFSEAATKRNQLTNGVLTMLESSDEAPVQTIMQTPVAATPTPTSTTTAAKTTANNLVLFMASNPLDTASLQLSKEFDAVFSTLQNSQFTVKKEGNVTYRKLQTTILKNSPRILHFSGHGLGSGKSMPTDERTRSIVRLSKSGLVLEDDQRNAKVLETRQLKQMFQIFSEAAEINIDIVVLNACYSQEQATAISEYVNYVIGMNDAIGDAAAISFASSFYENLAIADNVESAFRFAKLAIDVDGLKEEHKPVLLKKAK
jgi:hypothetical protein